ncbi:uncharacterized protein LOC107046021 [Diachasma alloeum]|uniref:uncharacterized protein LOC107046021 n=1 Tax=Diachasma alloeum TaxID=454923 RepID=UPI000738482A|nr:uncharacterized protein LOC107046021 [Diachasma alloeum]
MNSDENTILSHAGSLQKGNPSIGSDRVKASAAAPNAEPVQALLPPHTSRSRTDSETAVKDSKVEDSSTTQLTRDLGTREVRKQVRRKRSKGSPAAKAQKLKKLKQQVLPSKTAPQGKGVVDGSDWKLIESKRAKKKRDEKLLQKPPSEKKEPKKQKQKKTRWKPAPRPDALIVRPKKKEQHSDILRRIKKDAPAEKAQDCVDEIRRTATGDMLIILTRKTVDGAPQLRRTIASLLGDKVAVLSKGPEEELEIKDLDETTSKEDVLEALQKVAGEEIKIAPEAIKSLRTAYGGIQTALGTLAAATAKKILGEHGKIKIGWVNCRIRRVGRPIKCFKYWHYGHLATKCTSTVDWSKVCVKCAGDGHKAKDGKGNPRCALCSENGD